MDNPRPEKVAVVDEVRTRLSSSSASLLTEYRGLNVKDLAALRASITAAGGEYRIYKNTLVRLAASDLGLEGVDDLLTGPTAIAFVTGDAVLVAKSLRDFAKTNPNLVIKGGLLGTTVMSATDATALADVAPREVLLAQLAGGLAAPLRTFAGLLAAIPRNFAYGLKALIDKQGGAPEAAPVEEPEAAPAPEAEATPTDEPAAEPAADAAAEPDAEADAEPAPSDPTLSDPTLSDSESEEKE